MPLIMQDRYLVTAGTIQEKHQFEMVANARAVDLSWKTPREVTVSQDNKVIATYRRGRKLETP